jgi:hypothetical protein
MRLCTGATTLLDSVVIIANDWIQVSSGAFHASQIAYVFQANE